MQTFLRVNYVYIFFYIKFFGCSGDLEKKDETDRNEVDWNHCEIGEGGGGYSAEMNGRHTFFSLVFEGS
jgi:hypothetical protein